MREQPSGSKLMAELIRTPSDVEPRLILVTVRRLARGDKRDYDPYDNCGDGSQGEKQDRG